MIKKFIRYIKWILKRKPYLTYEGYNCGCCGNWINEKFSIPEYKSAGKWWDTWGLCDKCGNAR